MSVTDMSFVVHDRTIPGYLAVPPADDGRTQPWPGVVVIHEAFGLTADIKEKAREFAAHGYLALAPDLFGGKSWTGCVLSAFRQLRSGTGPAFDIIDSARAQLAERADCTGKIGVIGFCLGGGFALMCAPGHGFDAASVNYGDVPKDAENVLAGACPVVGSFGARDQMGTEGPERLQRALAVREIRHDVKVYPNSGHRFMSKASGAAAVFAKMARMSYNQEDAADAWRRIYAFFAETLSTPSTPESPTM